MQHLFGSLYFRKSSLTGFNDSSSDGGEDSDDCWVPASHLRGKYVLLFLPDPVFGRNSFPSEVSPPPNSSSRVAALLARFVRRHNGDPSLRAALAVLEVRRGPTGDETARLSAMPSPSAVAVAAIAAAAVAAAPSVRSTSRSSSSSLLRGAELSQTVGGPPLVPQSSGERAHREAQHANGANEADEKAGMVEREAEEAKEANADEALWLTLESGVAYRRVMRTFGVTSWPTVLLFAPNGHLLTADALTHIENEMSTAVTEPIDDSLHTRMEKTISDCSASTSSNRDKSKGSSLHNGEEMDGECDGPPLVLSPMRGDHSNGGEDIDGMMGDRFGEERSSMRGKGYLPGFPACPFPWVEEDTNAHVGSLPLPLRHLLAQARRVQDVLDGGAAAPLSPMATANEASPLHTLMDGASHLAICFGARWHPACGPFLPRLRRLWSAMNDEPATDEDGKESHIPERRLRTFAFGTGGCGGNSLALLGGMASYQMGTMAGRSSVSLISDDPAAAAAWSRESHESSPKIASLGGWSVRRATTTTTNTAAADDADPPAPSHTPFGSLHERPPASGECEPPHLRPPQRRRRPRLQVLYVSCDAEESALLATLDALPASWLCVAACLGADAHALVEACREALQVRVLPRVALLEWRAAEAVGEAFPAARLVRRHAEMDMGTDERGDHFPWTHTPESSPENTPEESETDDDDDAERAPQLPFHRLAVVDCLTYAAGTRALRTVVANGGSLVLLCSTGCVTAELHEVSAAALREARVWCAQEVERLGTTSPGPTPLSGGRPAPTPLLPVCFMDTIPSERPGGSGGGGDFGAETASDASSADSAFAEERALLQEYVLAAALEEGEQLLPPVAGEVYLLVAQWPERHVAGLRRRLEFEGVPTPATASGRAASHTPATSARVSPFPPLPASTAESLASTTAALASTVTPGGSTGVPLIDVTSGLSSLSTTLRTEKSPEPCVTNPVCSAPHVKAFIAKHVFGKIV